MKRQILVVDDEAGARTLIAIMLLGHWVEMRSVMLDEHPAIAVVLMDIMMPGMDGIELCQTIRGGDATSKTPVLILSARGDAQSIIRGIEAGANDYLQKPILHNDLVAKVRSMLGVGVEA